MRDVAVKGFARANLHDIPDAAFEIVAAQLKDAGIYVNCFGTALGKKPDDFEAELAIARNIARRAERIGATKARVMSYSPNALPESEVFRRLNEISVILADGGVQTVFENCSNFAGMSAAHALRLVENVAGSKIVFDPGNCVGDADYGQVADENGVRPRQNAWEFYCAVKSEIAYFHVKDAVWENGKSATLFPPKVPPTSNAF